MRARSLRAPSIPTAFLRFGPWGGLVAGLLSALPASAAPDLKPVALPASEGQANPFWGSYRQSIAISTPPFHDLEPHLELTYDSSGGNGFVGTGWRLAGFSTIERASPGGGIPRYDDGDIYLLDGEELVPCPPGGPSPSCRAGGTHFAKTESFERIQRVRPAGPGLAGQEWWVVTDRFGTQRTYRPLGDLPPQWTTSICDEPAVCATSPVSVSGGGSGTSCQGFMGPVALPYLSASGGLIQFHNTAPVNQTCDFNVYLSGATASGWVSGWPTSINASGSTIAFGDATGRLLGTLTLVGATASGSVALGAPLQWVQANGGTLTFSGGGRSGTITLTGAAGCSPQQQCRPGYYRFGLSSVVDRRGNTVAYGWQCTEFSYGSNIPPGCYPLSIDYNGTHVGLIAEQRPDTQSKAIGGTYAFIWKRLKTIDVQQGGARLRAYKLTYSQSASSGRSLLASVQQFGRDATLDSAGTVTGGTALPPLGAGYSAQANAFGLGVWSSTPGWGGIYDANSPARTFTGDFNGDKRQDVLFTWVDGSTWVGLSDGAHLNFSRFSLIPGWAGLLNANTPHRMFVADFNGDGKDDLLIAFNNGQVFVGTSDGTTFNFQPWYSNPGWGGVFDSHSAARMFVEDLNNDGKADFVFTWPEPDSSASIWVGLSDGSHFGVSSFGNFPGWGPILHAGSTARVLPADVDGNGRRDLVILRNDGTVWVLRGTGSSFALYRFTSRDPAGFGGLEGSAGQPAPTFGSVLDVNSNARVFVGDFNGDGSSDLLLVRPTSTTPSAAELWIGISTGSRFEWSQWASAWGWGPIADAHSEARWFVGDFNGDGKTDVLFNWNDGSFWVGTAQGSTAMAFARWTIVNGWGGVVGAHSPARVHLGDFDGDGRIDYSFAWNDGTWWVGPSAGASPDLMTSFASGLGATTTISYLPSSAWPSANSPPVTQTVASVTTADGRGGSSTTSYQYGGGYYDASERRFLGFGYLKQLLPCLAGESACPYLDTWFSQTYGSLARPLRVDRRTTAGTLLASTQYGFAGSNTPPYVSQEVSRWDYSYDGVGNACPGNCKRNYVTRSYDPYGNVAIETSYGDWDRGDDDRTTQTVYVANTTDYIVSRPAVVQTFAGTAAAGTLLLQTLYYYDGQGRWDVAPAYGYPTQTLRWYDQTSSYVSTGAQYDGFGNLIATSDETGALSRVTFDDTYHLYPTGTTNALGHSTSAQYDAVCGVPLRTTDLNGQVTTISYDPLCRPSRADLPGGGFQITSYVNFGDPANQMVMTQTPAAAGGGTLWAQSFFDGLGRLRVSAARGPSGNRTILALTDFNPRGAVAGTTSPYYAGDAPVWTRYSYDALDRPSQTLYADGTHEDWSYGAATVLHTDAGGHQEQDTRDAYQQIVQHGEKIGSSWLYITYAFDLRGNPTRVTDPVGNAWALTYDSLGRRTRLQDPDRGVWTMDYDAAGREIGHTDALGQRTTLAYDPLGRLTSKTTRAGTALAQTVRWMFDESRAGTANLGHPTSMIDAGGSAVFDYDAAGRQSHIGRYVDRNFYEIRRAWDPGGRLVASTYPESGGPVTVRYQYDEAGRVAAIPGVVASVDYDAAGAARLEVNTNGTRTSRSYESAHHWLVSLQTTGPTGVLQLANYTRNAEGRLTAIDSPFVDDSWAYSYDDYHRLVAATDPVDASHNRSYAYDSVGNLSASSALGLYHYPPPASPRPHGVDAVLGDSYQYDANGNMVASPGRILNYDGDNRVVGINDTQIVYDANGNRLKKTSARGTTQYIGDDYRVSGSEVTRTITLGGLPVAEHRGAQTHWLHVDHRGEVELSTDASGKVIDRNHTGPYREPLEQTVDGEASKSADDSDEYGLIYMHARYYDPTLGRFLSPDPDLDSSRLLGLNAYAYASDDPINRIDPKGTEDYMLNGSFNPFYGPGQGWVPGANGQLAYPGSYQANQAQANSGVALSVFNVMANAPTSGTGYDFTADVFTAAAQSLAFFNMTAPSGSGPYGIGSIFTPSPFPQTLGGYRGLPSGGLLPDVARLLAGQVGAIATVPNILGAGLGPLSAVWSLMQQYTPPPQNGRAGTSTRSGRPPSGRPASPSAPPAPPIPPPALVALPKSDPPRSTNAPGDDSVGRVDLRPPSTRPGATATPGLMAGGETVGPSRGALRAPGPAGGNPYDDNGHVGAFPQLVNLSVGALTDAQVAAAYPAIADEVARFGVSSLTRYERQIYDRFLARQGAARYQAAFQAFQQNPLDAAAIAELFGAAGLPDRYSKDALRDPEVRDEYKREIDRLAGRRSQYLTLLLGKYEAANGRPYAGLAELTNRMTLNLLPVNPDLGGGPVRDAYLNAIATDLAFATMGQVSAGGDPALPPDPTEAARWLGAADAKLTEFAQFIQQYDQEQMRMFLDLAIADLGIVMSTIGGLASLGRSLLPGGPVVGPPVPPPTTFNPAAVTIEIRGVQAAVEAVEAAETEAAYALRMAGYKAVPFNAPGYVFTSFPDDALESVLQKGLLSGQALGEAPGGNASAVWFKQGQAFYSDGLVAIAKEDAVLAKGGYLTTGVAGQQGVVKLPFAAAAEGMAPGEFAVGVARGQGVVELVWAPPGFEVPGFPEAFIVKPIAGGSETPALDLLGAVLGQQIGSGQDKLVFAVEGRPDLVVLTTKTADPAKMADMATQLNTYRLLASRGARVPEVLSEGIAPNGGYGAVMNKIDIFTETSLEQADFVDQLGRIANQNTVADLQQMYNLFKGHPEWGGLDRASLIIDRGGRVYLSDVSYTLAADRYTATVAELRMFLRYAQISAGGR
jgi:RHS repeat-associated protein